MCVCVRVSSLLLPVRIVLLLLKKLLSKQLDRKMPVNGGPTRNADQQKTGIRLWEEGCKAPSNKETHLQLEVGRRSVTRVIHLPTHHRHVRTRTHACMHARASLVEARPGAALDLPFGPAPPSASPLPPQGTWGRTMTTCLRQRHLYARSICH